MVPYDASRPEDLIPGDWSYTLSHTIMLLARQATEFKSKHFHLGPAGPGRGVVMNGMN